ncbi:FluG domain-containing protein, partial [Metarhizium brunneum ARSEF 3297]
MTGRELHSDVLQALEVAARRRHRATLARKETQKHTLNAHGYHRLQRQLNKKTFLAPIDAETTKANIYYIKKKFMRFCREKQHGNWKNAIKWQYYDQPGSKPVMGVDDLLLGLTHHWCRDRSVFPTEGDRLDLSAIMLFQSYTACRPAELVDGTKSRGGKDPMLGDSDDEDSGAGLSVDRSHMIKLSAERQKILPRKKDESEEFDSEPGDAAFSEVDALDSNDTSDTDGDDAEDDSDEGTNISGNNVNMGGTQASLSRPCVGTDEVVSESIRKHKALCYEDIVLWIVQDPNQRGRDVLAMEVFFRYHKGADRKPKPTIFLFRENPLPILCPISHLLARAISDDAIEVGGFHHAAPLFSSHIRRKAIKVHWKPSVLKKPVFRRSVRTATGWLKSETEPMKYSAYAFYLDRIGSDLGSEEKWTSYCFRRGHANALLGVAPDSIVDQVMRHDPLTGCMQNAYQNCRIGFNTQDAFLERDPSADGLTRAFTHMSIRCNPEVPKEIPKAELDKLPPDPEVVSLAKHIRQRALCMRQEYGFIKSAPKVVREEYQQLRRDLKNAEKAFRADMTKVYQEACRRRIHNEELQKQLSGMTIDTELDGEPKLEPSVQHQLEERTQLQAILSDFRQDLDTKRTTDRKIRAVDLMVLLASRREVRPPAHSPSPSPRLYGSGIRGNTPDTKPVSPKVNVDEVPLILGKAQCIYCVGENQLPYNTRMRSFNRVSHMMDHVENVHLKHERDGGRFVCRHPQCTHLGDFLISLDAFKYHVQQVHGVKLRTSQV